ncbi:peptide-methionine (R)-S-oxide reductase [Maribacter vaceletii]|uniref:peptide-methionine (R)-S-oxide reductase n=1 Tax=Maribacter vaceletii TaxID=1206816 RepID=A0A495DSH1_9FLAO|nr:peptide-methionine (R)-S-oxide reductase MsrB [Maribacter vaceletii]RKR06457.1 peptide-methionine (R)-S-oxide reductase [Maribacter vaceletii]
MYIKIIAILLFVATSCKGISQNKDDKKETFKVSKTDAEWRKELTDMQYYILRQAGTEPAGTSKLLDNKKEGIYACAACSTPLFKSEHKFNSGTGWPSFDTEINGNVAFDVDYKIGYERTEEHCATCGGHLGHVFNDGPKNTTGKRHCINGAALKFVEK